jgi:transcriptional regulator GlxA family with amidase domain
MIARHTRRIAVVGFPEAQLLDICGPLEVFSRASRVITDEGRRGPDVYSVELLAHHAGPVRTSSGLALVAARSFRSVRGGIDTLLVAGGRGTDAALHDRALINWLRRIAPRVRRLASVCTGTFLLAEAGLLDGKRVTTHWASCQKLAAMYPRLTVDPDPIFIREGRLYTTAGVTSGMDLALALVAEDYNTAVSRAVARQLVMFLQRPGGQSQFSTHLQTQSADHRPLAELQAWMADHLAEDLSVSALARRAAMSSRNFARIFSKNLGSTPARLVQRMRVEAARRRLEESDEGVKTIAAECGFGTPESMRRAFLRAVRVPPSAYRSRFSDAPNGAQPTGTS